MTLSDLTNPEFYSSLLGVLTPLRASEAEVRRQPAWFAELEAEEEHRDFEDTRPFRWLLTEPPQCIEDAEHSCN